MSTWLFDLGNTRLKLARVAANGLLDEVRAVPHDDAGAWLQALPNDEVACIASVAGEARRVALLEALATRFVRLHLARTEVRFGPLEIAYAEPGHLGVDRFLALLSATGAGDVLLVGVGTALTIDLLDASGRHRGGRIAPSPDLMRAALHERAPVLPARGGTYAEFADDTPHALASGCEGAVIALIERSLAHAHGLLGTTPALWLHGGGAGALRDRLPPHRWHPEAVLHGLARWHEGAMASTRLDP